MTPATKNASGPVTTRAASLQSTTPSYRLACAPSRQDNGYRASRVEGAGRSRGAGGGGRAARPAGRQAARPPDADPRLSQGEGSAAGRDPPPRSRGGARRGAAE